MELNRRNETARNGYLNVEALARLLRLVSVPFRHGFSVDAGCDVPRAPAMSKYREREGRDLKRNACGADLGIDRARPEAVLHEMAQGLELLLGFDALRFDAAILMEEASHGKTAFDGDLFGPEGFEGGVLSANDAADFAGVDSGPALHNDESSGRLGEPLQHLLDDGLADFLLAPHPFRRSLDAGNVSSDVLRRGERTLLFSQPSAEGLERRDAVAAGRLSGGERLFESLQLQLPPIDVADVYKPVSQVPLHFASMLPAVAFYFPGPNDVPLHVLVGDVQSGLGALALGFVAERVFFEAVELPQGRAVVVSAGRDVKPAPLEASLDDVGFPFSSASETDVATLPFSAVSVQHRHTRRHTKSASKGNRMSDKYLENGSTGLQISCSTPELRRRGRHLRSKNSSLATPVATPDSLLTAVSTSLVAKRKQVTELSTLRSASCECFDDSAAVRS
jgi:hypothetical protein